jgi:hypothetical protein
VRLALVLVGSLGEAEDVLLREVAHPDLVRHVEAEGLEPEAEPGLEALGERPGLVGLAPLAVPADQILVDPALLELSVLDERDRHGWLSAPRLGVGAWRHDPLDQGNPRRNASDWMGRKVTPEVKNVPVFPVNVNVAVAVVE